VTRHHVSARATWRAVLRRDGEKRRGREAQTLSVWIGLKAVGRMFLGFSLWPLWDDVQKFAVVTSGRDGGAAG
jgi:hypothetical protein